MVQAASTASSLGNPPPPPPPHSRRGAGVVCLSLCLPRPGTELMLFNSVCQVKEETVSEILGTQADVPVPPLHSLCDLGQVGDVPSAAPLSSSVK